MCIGIGIGKYVCTLCCAQSMWCTKNWRSLLYQPIVRKLPRWADFIYKANFSCGFSFIITQIWAFTLNFCCCFFSTLFSNFFFVAATFLCSYHSLHENKTKFLFSILNFILNFSSSSHKCTKSISRITFRQRCDNRMQRRSIAEIN